MVDTLKNIRIINLAGDCKEDWIIEADGFSVDNAIENAVIKIDEERTYTWKEVGSNAAYDRNLGFRIEDEDDGNWRPSGRFILVTDQTAKWEKALDKLETVATRARGDEFQSQVQEALDEVLDVATEYDDVKTQAEEALSQTRWAYLDGEIVLRAA